MNAEQNALGRVLKAAKEIYAALSRGEINNAPAMLDCLSAALSHLNDEKQPLHKVLGAMKRELKALDRELFMRVKPFFAKIYPVLDYDFEKAVKHVPAMIFANDKICVQYVSGERDKAAAMCDAMKSYPGFLFGEFEALSDAQFYDLVFGYYPKLYEKDDFMGEMKPLFVS